MTRASSVMVWLALSLDISKSLSTASSAPCALDTSTLVSLMSRCVIPLLCVCATARRSPSSRRERVAGGGGIVCFVSHCSRFSSP